MRHSQSHDSLPNISFCSALARLRRRFVGDRHRNRLVRRDSDVSCRSLVCRKRPCGMAACESHTFDGGACIERSWKAVLFSGGAAVALIGLFWRRDDIAEMIRPRWFLAFWPLGIAALLLFIGEAGEDFHHEGVEEMLEFAAYLYALCFGVWVLRHTQSASVHARPDLTGFQAAETRGAPQSHPHPQG